MGSFLRAVRDVATLLSAIGYCAQQLHGFGAPKESVPAQTPEPEADNVNDSALGDDFLYDTVARMNETVVANIDTTDLALLAVSGGAMAVLVFGIDKVGELAPPWEAWAYCFLGSSVVACTIGYLIGIGSPREPGDPASFTAASIENPDQAIAVAIRDVAQAYGLNAGIRLRKRIGIVAALTMLIAGTVVIALARSLGAVV